MSRENKKLVKTLNSALKINVHEALLYLETTFEVCGDDMPQDRVLSANIQPPDDPAHGSDGDSGDEDTSIPVG